jgi:hypothetical protein
MGRWYQRNLVLAAAVTLVLPMAPVASAASPSGSGDNPVVVWDLNAQTAIWDVARQQPNVQGRSFAMVHGAVYDAVNAIAGRPYQPYLSAPPVDGTESVDAAVGTAAHVVLDSLFPDQRDRLRTQYDAWLATIPDGRAKRGGIAVGERTAAVMIAARRNDGAFGDQTWVVGTRPGEWRPTPPTFGSDSAWSGHVRPFLVPDASRFTTAGPPALTSSAYARDVNEVKLVGRATNATRTPDQTQAAVWWHDRNNVMWQIKRQLATGQRLSVLRTARLFALVDLIGADAAIACFAQKEAWTFWRPVTAIQLADTDGNPRTVADPEWLPLLVTPPFPEYPSGHACGTAARMTTYALFFGRDRIPFSAYSVDADATRHFTSFSGALAELVDARVWGGVHFRTADVHGAVLGAAVARYAIEHHLQPRR